MTENKKHIPVLISEVLDFSSNLIGLENPLIVDGTFGEGGHSSLFHEKYPQSLILGFDRDPQMCSRAAEILKSRNISCKKVGRTDEIERTGIHIFNESYGKIPDVLEKLGRKADFVLLDLGVSIFHFSGAARGFSYTDESLDMRLSPDLPLKASDILNQYTEKEMKDLFQNLGEEKFAGRIASAVKKNLPVESAARLAEIVQKAVPRLDGKKRHIHPATRVFQALRIEVNQELKEAEFALSVLPEWLSSGGRLAVISFHSLEDRIVKNAFKKIGEKQRPKKNPKKYRQLRDAPDFLILTPKPVLPGSDEIERNPPSRSAKLRVLEKKAENEP